MQRYDQSESGAEIMRHLVKVGFISGLIINEVNLIIKMALTFNCTLTFNCKGFNLCKVKHIESLLATCDVLLLQETWCLPDQVGNLNKYFREHNTYSLSARILHRAPPPPPPAPSRPKFSNSENCCGSENAMPPKIFWDMEGHRAHFRSKNVFFFQKTYFGKNS